MADLIEKDRKANTINNNKFFIHTVDWTVIPSMRQTAQIFAHIRPGIGISEDRNGSELYKVAPLACAKLLHPLIL